MPRHHFNGRQAVGSIETKIRRGLQYCHQDTLAQEPVLSGEPTRSTDNQAPPLTTGSRLERLAGVGVVLLGVAGAFLYLGGWFTPHALTPARFVDAFERVAGIHSGFRRNHAKGVCV